LYVFHQHKIVERNLTKRPELAASKELHNIVKWLAHTDKESFVGLFEDWEKRCESFVNERKKNADLFITIPNTTNLFLQ
jgi:hypothetical protein